MSKKGDKMIGALIVTYNPDLDMLLRNILAIKQQVDQVMIVDNGSKNIKEIKNIAIKNDLSDLQIVALEINKGIAQALNVGIGVFATKKFKWVMTLDQDSIIADDTINILKGTDEYLSSQTAILAPEFINREQESLIDVHNNSENRDKVFSIIERDDVITSGSLTNISAWQIVGGFDDQLFIDMVDYDFNQRLLGLGYKVYQVQGLYFEHSLGEGVKQTIFQKILFINKPTDHSTMRTYYWYRNQIIFIKRYQNYKVLRILNLLLSMRYIFVLSNPMLKMKSAFRGYIDGILYAPRKDDFFKLYLRKSRIRNYEEY